MRKPQEDVFHTRALITGATSGLGLAFARALAARGLALSLVARNAERLAETRDQLTRRYGVPIEILPADLSHPSGQAAVCEHLSQQDEPVEILVNNAGRGLYGSVVDDAENHVSAHELMVRAPLLLAGAAGAAMAERGHGVIINVSSVSALVPMGDYSAIKSWLRVFSLSLRAELAERGVRVHALLPGWTRSEFHERAGTKRSNIPDYFWLEPETVVEECLAGVARGRAEIIPTRRYRAVACLARHAPTNLLSQIVTRINKGRS